jgi:hypothetical protein
MLYSPPSTVPVFSPLPEALCGFCGEDLGNLASERGRVYRCPRCKTPYIFAATVTAAVSALAAALWLRAEDIALTGGPTKRGLLYSGYDPTQPLNPHEVSTALGLSRPAVLSHLWKQIAPAKKGMPTFLRFPGAGKRSPNDELSDWIIPRHAVAAFRLVGRKPYTMTKRVAPLPVEDDEDEEEIKPRAPTDNRKKSRA